MLAAARCNLFSYSLATYQSSWIQLLQKNQEVLEAHIKLIDKEPRKHKFGILKDLAQEVGESDSENKEEGEPSKMKVNDKDTRLFFGDEFSDHSRPSEKKGEEIISSDGNSGRINEAAGASLIDYEKDFDEFMSSSSLLLPSQLLMDDSLFDGGVNESNYDLLGSLVPTQADQGLLTAGKENSIQLKKNPSKKASDVSKWFNLFSELDPLNQQSEQEDASKNLHAA